MRGAVLRGIGAKAAYTMTCIGAAVVLAVSGFSYKLVGTVSRIGGSTAIKSGPSIGAQNILLMGLESRTDWNGNILPGNILSHLHAGSYYGIKYHGVGGDATNTLILIHIFAGGKKAVGFSIPRDDWVNFADTLGLQQQGKIDQAYGVSMASKEGDLRARYPGIKQDRVAFLGNEAGRAAAVATVQQLTGVRVDHFAEINLDGFYELAKVLGGVNVCLNHAVYDSNSGADFRAGYQHLNPTQALAFVRQRDGLTNGDLDRTHRQQAFLDSVLHQLRTEGVLSDLTKVQALLNVAQRYVITDSGWNLLDFVAQARGITAGNIVFHTLPIEGYQTIGGQDANLVNPAYIKKIVHAAFYPSPNAPRPSPSKTVAAHVTVDVFNGGYTAGLAGKVSAGLVSAGYHAGKVGNTATRSTTEIEYGSGASAGAAAIAAKFGVTAVPGAAVAAGHVEILLGTSANLPHFSPVTQHKHPVAIPTTGAQGGAVIAKGGVPCVN